MIYFLLFLQVVILIVSIGLFVRFAGMIVSLWYEVPFVRTPKEVYPEIVQALGVEKSGKIADLGSGFGDFCFYLASIERQAVSVEINPVLVFTQRCKNLLARQKITIRRQDFSELSLDDIDAAFLYWQPKVIDEHFPALLGRAGKGTVFASYFYSFPKEYRKRQKQIELSNGQSLYVIKA